MEHKRACIGPRTIPVLAGGIDCWELSGQTEFLVMPQAGAELEVNVDGAAADQIELHPGCIPALPRARSTSARGMIHTGQTSATPL